MPRLETKRDELVLLRSASDDVGSVEGYDVAVVIIVGLPCDGVGNVGNVETIVVLARPKTVAMDDILVWLRSD